MAIFLEEDDRGLTWPRDSENGHKGQIQYADRGTGKNRGWLQI